VRLVGELGSRAVKLFGGLGFWGIGASLQVRVRLEMHTYHTTGGAAQHWTAQCNAFSQVYY